MKRNETRFQISDFKFQIFQPVRASISICNLQSPICNFIMPPFLFWIFALLMLIFGAAVVINRNPIASALNLVVSFLGLAALFMSLDAFFVGIIQVLVYAGAIMVLFLFIIMLLDLRAEERRRVSWLALIGGIAVALALLAQIFYVIHNLKSAHQTFPPLAR